MKISKKKLLKKLKKSHYIGYESGYKKGYLKGKNSGLEEGIGIGRIGGIKEFKSSFPLIPVFIIGTLTGIIILEVLVYIGYIPVSAFFFKY